ncbi:HPr(Ser) kinase/phosphatase [Solemya pervernicosa gill symbiont]|uniref:HPr kinase/phosphorylase n=2 Tax=Gammaproteobacteria incertae sedis TaxID=118884 RepID=A0A1T2L745_9GAMM|nr:HPr(Ser) kinase/phosphatase [Candidatus Reidiella endopervernicosa]OOZ40880.1 HPr(Ser) kinase/phosphatase [Solemya pervernicosa gill symbiont]QKQ26152.1 HPr(Ser) kinase/phosphatase [Candidatus Reidiella endopervernicosa]
MSNAISTRTLFDNLHEKLSLQWLAGACGEERKIETDTLHATGSSMVGHLNVIHPNPIQVLGAEELEFLASLGKNSREDILKQLFSEQTSITIVTDNLIPPESFQRLADEHCTPLLGTPFASHDLVSRLQYYLTNLLAERITLHGVFMEVMGSGVLITGPSSSGKSELALELVTRGHRLVADDAPEFARIAPDIISGSCPHVLQDFLEVRGLGVLNIREMYGDSAIKQGKYLRLIINLAVLSDEELQKIDRLRGNQRLRKLLNIDIPEITLPVAPGRNLSVLVEAAVRNHLLTQKGINASQTFIDRQQRFMEKQE